MLSVFVKLFNWKSIVGTRSLVSLFALTIFAIAGVVEARPVAMPFAEVVDISYNELVVEFVKAQTLAGFTLKRKDGKESSTTLVFDYLTSGTSSKRGIAEFRIRNKDSNSDICSPCEIYNVLWGVVGRDYGSSEDDLFQKEIDIHVNEAKTFFIKKLKLKYKEIEGRPAYPVGSPNAK